MTSKLLKKLQITTRKLTASVPGMCCASWRGILTTAAAAFLAMGAANGLAEENSSVRLVSYEQIQASAESAVTSSSSMSGNQLSWVSVSSPEARVIKAETAAVSPAVGTRVNVNRVTLRQVSDPATEPVLSPIPDGLDMPALNLDSMGDVDLSVHQCSSDGRSQQRGR